MTKLGLLVAALTVFYLGCQTQLTKKRVPLPEEAVQPSITPDIIASDYQNENIDIKKIKFGLVAQSRSQYGVRGLQLIPQNMLKEINLKITLCPLNKEKLTQCPCKEVTSSMLHMETDFSLCSETYDISYKACLAHETAGQASCSASKSIYYKVNRENSHEIITKINEIKSLNHKIKDVALKSQSAIKEYSDNITESTNDEEKTFNQMALNVSRMNPQLYSDLMSSTDIDELNEAQQKKSNSEGGLHLNGYDTSGAVFIAVGGTFTLLFVAHNIFLRNSSSIFKTLNGTSKGLAAAVMSVSDTIGKGIHTFATALKKGGGAFSGKTWTDAWKNQKGSISTDPSIINKEGTTFIETGVLNRNKPALESRASTVLGLSVGILAIGVVLKALGESANLAETPKGKLMSQLNDFAKERNNIVDQVTKLQNELKELESTN